MPVGGLCNTIRDDNSSLTIPERILKCQESELAFPSFKHWADTQPGVQRKSVGQWVLIGHATDATFIQFGYCVPLLSILVSPLFMMVSDGYVGKRASATAKAAWAPQEGEHFKLNFIRLQPRMHMIQDFRRLKEILHLTNAIT